MMRPSNPACYECSKGHHGLHTWKLRDDRTSKCVECGLELNAIDTAEVFELPVTGSNEAA